MIHVAIEVWRWSALLHIGPIEDEAEAEPEPSGATSGVLDRAPTWDHDNRSPIGFTLPVRSAT